MRKHLLICWIRVHQDFNHVGQDYNHLKTWLKPEDPLPRWLTHMLLIGGFSSSPGGSPHKMSLWRGQCPSTKNGKKRERREEEGTGGEGEEKLHCLWKHNLKIDIPSLFLYSFVTQNTTSTSTIWKETTQNSEYQEARIIMDHSWGWLPQSGPEPTVQTQHPLLYHFVSYQVGHSSVTCHFTHYSPAATHVFQYMRTVVFPLRRFAYALPST